MRSALHVRLLWNLQAFASANPAKTPAPEFSQFKWGDIQIKPLLDGAAAPVEGSIGNK